MGHTLKVILALCAVACLGTSLAFLQHAGTAKPPQSHPVVEARQPSVRTGSVPVELEDVDLPAASTAQEEESTFSSMLRWVGAGLVAGIVAATMSSPVHAAFSEPRTGTRTLLGAFKSNDMTYNGDVGAILQRASVKNWSHLEPCKDNKKYQKRYKDLKFKLEKRRDKYPINSRAYKVENQVVKNEAITYESYGDRYCAKADGLPRVIATGENVRGGIFIPFVLFIYTTGWIGWAGREYLLRTKSVQKEVFIDVPILLSCMTSGFAWPVKAWQDFTNGRFVAPDNQISTDVFYKIW